MILQCMNNYKIEYLVPELPIHEIQSVVLSMMFLLTAGGTALTSMVLLNLSIAGGDNQSDLVAIFVVETIGAIGMIICYVSYSV